VYRIAVSAKTWVPSAAVIVTSRSSVGEVGEPSEKVHERLPPQDKRSTALLRLPVNPPTIAE
jgi:hypothetical protein